MCLFFFFKQKTAYEMRISDWSSDVCSSDLRAAYLAASAQGIKVDGYKPDEKTKAAAEREALRQGGVPDNQARSTRTANQARDTREQARSEEHTSELQSLMRISDAVFCLKKKKKNNQQHQQPQTRDTQHYHT